MTLGNLRKVLVATRFEVIENEENGFESVTYDYLSKDTDTLYDRLLWLEKRNRRQVKFIDYNRPGQAIVISLK